METRAKLKNKIDDEWAPKILQAYSGGMGTATISRTLGFKTHCVERFIRDSGLMRDRKVAAAMAIRRIAETNVGKTNKERMR